MDKRRKIALLLLFPLLGVTALCGAQVPYVGPYAGGDELMARLDPKRSATLDSNPVKDRYLGWKGLVGLRFTPRLAFEAGFMDFGRISPLVSNANAPSQARTKAFTAFGVGTVPVGKFEMFAKAGPTRMQAIGHAGGVYYDRQEKRIAWGTGVQLTKRRLAVRAEYEKFGSSSMGDLNAVSLGFRVSFRPNNR